MAYKKIDESILVNTGDAIRDKLGTGSFFHPHDFPSAIRRIKGNPNVQPKSIYANGLYSVSSGVDGFNPVVVSVPNTYSVGDNGKVVSGASLVGQTPLSIDENGVYDTTFKNSITVAVPEGGDITSDATLTSGSQMLSGYTAYARGSKYTGTIPMYNGSINSGSGSVPTYDYYSGSYVITPSTVDQAFPTAGFIMSQNLQVLSYSMGSGEPYDGSYVITPSIFSQAFPTAGKLLSEDIIVEPYSIDFYSGSYAFEPSTELITVPTSGKTLVSDIQINAYSGSGDARPPYEGSYVVIPSWLQQTLPTSGKVMTDDLIIEAYEQPEVYDGSYVVTPSTVEQSFPTADLLMHDNFVVEAYSQASLITQNISENGIYYASDYDADGFSEVVVSVSGGTEAVLISATFSSYNQTYYASDYEADGFSEVHVSVGMAPPNITIVGTGEFRAYDYSSYGWNGFRTFTVIDKPDFSAMLSIGSSAYSNTIGISSLNLDSTSTIGEKAFARCYDLATVNAPICSNVGDYTFASCPNLSAVYMPSLNFIKNFQFQDCSALEIVDTPNCIGIFAEAFEGCVALSSCSFQNVADIQGGAFRNCSLLSDLTFDNAQVVHLAFSSVFEGTPFVQNDSAYARIHVPSALISDYKADSKWSYFSNCIVPIEEGE